MKSNLENYIKTKLNIMNLYQLLADFFYYPRKYLTEKNELMKELVKAFASLFPEKEKEILEFESILQSSSGEELLIEFTRLFIGSVEFVAPPYGSFYLEGHLMGKTTLETETFYKKAGLQLKNDFNEIPDHIAVEFEFMYYLIHRELKSLLENKEAEAEEFLQWQYEFLEKFLEKWIYPFCKTVKEGTSHRLFYLLANFIKELIKTHRSN